MAILVPHRGKDFPLDGFGNVRFLPNAKTSQFLLYPALFPMTITFYFEMDFSYRLYY